MYHEFFMPYVKLMSIVISTIIVGGGVTSLKRYLFSDFTVGNRFGPHKKLLFGLPVWEI
jgi:hypothetical protein